MGALGVPGALAAVLVALVAFAVVIGVCFVVLRLISFVLSGSEDEAAASGADTEPVGDGPEEPAEPS